MLLNENMLFVNVLNSRSNYNILRLGVLCSEKLSDLVSNAIV